MVLPAQATGRSPMLRFELMFSAVVCFSTRGVPGKFVVMTPAPPRPLAHVVALSSAGVTTKLVGVIEPVSWTGNSFGLVTRDLIVVWMPGYSLSVMVAVAVSGVIVDA